MSQASISKLTPMMQQWTACKNQAKNALLLFRLGDFYEAFGEDAEIAARELDVTLTKRHETAMCGIPWHSAEGYIDRLVAKGFSVAIAEQLEPAGSTKGLVERKIVRTVTPGTTLSQALIDETANNYVMALYSARGKYGIAKIDLATAQFAAMETDDLSLLHHELFTTQPKELFIARAQQPLLSSILESAKNYATFSLQFIDAWRFEEHSANLFLNNHFKIIGCATLGFTSSPLALQAGGALLSHLHEELLQPIQHLRSLKPISRQGIVQLDRATTTNLEIFETRSQSKSARSLFSHLNQTATPMGSRLLRQWLQLPSAHLETLIDRQEAIQEVVQTIQETTQKSPRSTYTLQEGLSSIRDLERLMIRITASSSSPRELMALSHSLLGIEKVKPFLEHCTSKILQQTAAQITSHPEIAKRIQSALVEAPPFRLSEGGSFKRGYSPELDELLMIKDGGDTWLLQYQASLREEFGIKTLKISFSRAFGYFIEVSRGQADKMPSTFSRRQTLVNAERFISPELKSFEEKVLSAETKIRQLEEKLFQELKQEVSQASQTILQSAHAIALIDVTLALAQVACKHRYIRPQLHRGSSLSIIGGRHPVGELYDGRSFVPNDLLLDAQTSSLMLITGPNMGGKSTYIRQQALLVLLAHIGSFIPAKSASIGLVDRIFSRVGASDDLGAGQSTFMVEMAETAAILNQATPQSLIILDEIGRGTSTYDGISLAWAIVEHLIKDPQQRPKTLFATHYYELTELESLTPHVANYSVAVSEVGHEIQFLYKIIPGKADKSYGLHVAKLAGLPASLIQRAAEILRRLETKESQPALQMNGPLSQSEPQALQPPLPLPVDHRAACCLEFIQQLNLSTISPMDCYLQLHKLKNDIDILSPSDLWDR